MINLYNYAGVPYKTQEKIRDVLTKLYSATPDGYCGDEDNGQTSAWYVFCSLGFYPVTPATDEYIIGSSLFDKATLHLENGNTFVIQATNNSEENFYIQSAELNGENYTHNYLKYESIQNGGTLTFDMSDKPNKEWGSKESDVPYSLSKKN
jgi:predicted alpha-1,2-mannosidase